MSKIITISRQYGSGGREIGKMVAEKLGIPFYDSQLIKLAAEKSGFSEKHFEDPEKNAGNSFLYSIARGMQHQYRTATPWSFEETVYNTQSDVIRSVAAQGPAVFIGRCADYILRNNPDLFKVFIFADYDFRAERAVRVNGVAPEDVKETIKVKDKRRANYYNYHSDTKWGDATNYHLSIDSGFCGIERAAEIIVSLAK
ncbi:MAG: cytidylate kinase-like family protein [Clostridia bacterium]|nr:cytidylate kinase-like family protein [Clostridia bacterium]